MENEKRGNFRLDKNGDISFYVGWCNLEYKDIEDLKYLMARRELNKLKEKE